MRQSSRERRKGKRGGSGGNLKNETESEEWKEERRT